MSLPKFLQPYLASYDLGKMSVNDDKETIITQILNSGDRKAVRWLFEKYPVKEIKKAVRKPRRGSWLPESLHYWKTIFNLKIPKSTYQLALFSLQPQPELYQKFYSERKNALSFNLK
jgi:hypothetical protein